MSKEPVSPGTLSGLSHVAIAVPDLEAAAAQLQRKLGVAAGPVHENPVQQVRLCYFELGNARIELISPASPQAPLQRFLDKHPAGGLHHIAFAVPELDAALAAVTGAGVRMSGASGSNVEGCRIAFLNPKDVLGVLVELEEHKK